MTTSSPTVSVTMPVFNEERFIGAAIESVLEQTLQDFELIIVDDGSTDRTPEILATYSDPRIHVIRQRRQGVAAASNTAVAHSRAEIIALTSGNEECEPHRLERQLHVLERERRDVLVSWVSFIDEHSQPASTAHFARDLFNHPPRDRASMLRRFFFQGNYLCDVTLMLRRSVYDATGLYRSTAFELCDFDLWLRVIGLFDITMLPEPLVRYRVLNPGQNMSNPRDGVRSIFECYQVYRRFFDAIPADLFRAAFAEQLRNADFRQGIEYELEKSFLYLAHQAEIVQGVGVERLVELLEDPEVQEVAQSRYGFGVLEAIDLTQRVDWTKHRRLTELTSRSAAELPVACAAPLVESETAREEAGEQQSGADESGRERCSFSADAIATDTHERYGRWGYAVPFPSQALMATVGADSFENFLVVGDTWFQLVAKILVRDIVPRRPGAELTMLDFGCGCGRLARYFLWWPQLTYVGVDIFRSSIEWCEEYLRPLAPRRCRFIFFDGKSEHYNQSGSIAISSYTVPVDSQSVDFVVAASLFTHLLEPDARAAFGETFRMLRPGGRALMSILTDVSDGARYSGDEFRADFETTFFIELAAQAGLSFAEDFGVLCGERILMFERPDLPAVGGRDVPPQISEK